MKQDMQYELRQSPAYTVVEVTLERGETVTSEAGAMVSHSEEIRLETGIGDEDEGMFSSLKDSVLGDESLFRNRFTSEGGQGTVELAPSTPGDVTALTLDRDELYLQGGAYIGCGTDVSIDSELGGLDTLLGGEGISLIKAHGSGVLFIGSFGGIDRKEIQRDETLTVDSGHIVAWNADMDYETRRVGGLKETVLSGEGLVMDFTGPGVVFTQTRNYDGFVTQLTEDMPFSGASGDDGGNIDIDI
jgi:conserved hypothetical protein TIGR00266